MLDKTMTVGAAAKAAPFADSSRFDFLGKLLQTDLREELEKYFRGELDRPLIVELDPTSACNFSCGNCVSADLLNSGHMPTDELLQLVDTMHDVGVRAVILIGGGEPLAHPAIRQVLTRLKSYGIAVGLTTNGSFISRYLDEVAESCSWVRVSVDAASQELFDLVRPSRAADAFQKVTDNIKLLAARKSGTAVGFSFLTQWRKAELNDLARGVGIVKADGETFFTNICEITSATELARSLGCDYFEAKPSVSGGSVSDHTLESVPHSLAPILWREMEAARALATQDGQFSVVFAPGLAHLEEGLVDQPKAYSTCPSIHLRTLITHEGVFPCPYFRGRDDLMIVDPIAALTNWRATGVVLDETVNPSRDCSFFCIRHRPNLFLSAVAELKDAGVNVSPYLAKTQVDNDPFF